MASVRTLLERIEEPEEAQDRELEESPDQLLESIRANVGRILNSQRGYAPIAPEYGLAELIDVSLTNNSMGKIEADLRRSIEMFEPRLDNVQVRFVAANDHRLALRFDVIGTMRVRDEERPARFMTLLEPSGELDVRRT